MKKRGLLLDRDGVINVDHGYVGRREQFQFIDGIFPFLRAAQDMGYRLAVITNQAGVARGYYTREDYENLTQWMRRELAREGIALDLVLACFEHDKGVVPALTRVSFWRKPNAGMVLEAIQRLGLDPERSAFIGDKPSDMDAAERGGIKTRLLFNGDMAEVAMNAVRVRNYDEALEQLKVTPA